MTPAQKKDDFDPGRSYGQGYEYFGMALSFTIAILLFGAAGWGVDGWVHTRALFANIGAFGGGFAGVLGIYYRGKGETAAKRVGGRGAASRTGLRWVAGAVCG